MLIHTDKLSYIYKITNKNNGKVYIGKTTSNNPKMRFYSHAYGRSGSPKINNAFKKYGKDGFDWDVIDTALSHIELDIKEMKWISHYSSTNDDYGYNIQYGGGGCYTHSEKTKRKISKVHKGVPKTKSAKKRMSEAWTEERKNKIAKFNKRTKSKPVYKYDMEGNFVCGYNSLTEAGKDVGVSRANIWEVASGKYKSSKGFQWEYYKKPKISPYKI